MLNRLLPRTSVIAGSGALMRMAVIDAAGSGRDVLNARNCVPAKLASQPVAWVRPSPIRVNYNAVPTTTSATST